VQHLGDTACAGAEAVAALAAEAECREQLARAGAVHALLPAALQYDYTLEESGVEADAAANKQVKCAAIFICSFLQKIREIGHFLNVYYALQFLICTVHLTI
jgi:hypothetical protein